MLIFSKRVRGEMLFKREEDNGLDRQLGKPRVVYDPFFFYFVFGGARVVYRGVTVKDF